MPVVTLNEAIRRIRGICQQQELPYPNKFQLLGSNVYTAEQFVKRNWGNNLETKYAGRGLTQDLAMFINFYTHESPFYPRLNATLRSENRSALAPYLPFIKARD